MSLTNCAEIYKNGNGEDREKLRGKNNVTAHPSSWKHRKFTCLRIAAALRTDSIRQPDSCSCDLDTNWFCYPTTPLEPKVPLNNLQSPVEGWTLEEVRDSYEEGEDRIRQTPPGEFLGTPCAAFVRVGAAVLHALGAGATPRVAVVMVDVAIEELLVSATKRRVLLYWSLIVRGDRSSGT